jgi:N-acetylglutamate synthase
VLLAAWPAVEHERLGAWTLRFSGGFTGRANSVLPHGEPGIALEQAVVRCEQAYGARGLPARFQLRDGHALAGLEQVLDRRGYREDNRALVLAGPMPAAAADDEVAHADVPSEDWLDTWRAVSRRPSATQEPHARALLALVSQPRTFSLLRAGGRPVATALGTRSPGWLGLSCLAVREDARRHGAASRLLAALASWAQGAEGLWLEVERENEIAIAWYGRLGLRPAGAYRYRTAPSIARTAS